MNNADEMRIIMDLSSWILFNGFIVSKGILSNVKDKWKPFEGEITITFLRIIKHTNFKHIPSDYMKSESTTTVTHTHAGSDMFVQVIVDKNKSQNRFDYLQNIYNRHCSPPNG